jgi:hypothetical protein
MSELIIKETIRYWSQRDEDYFFAWLKSVPGFVNVIGEGRELHVYLAPTPDTIRELAALFKRYGLDTSVLQDLSPGSDT